MVCAGASGKDSCQEKIISSTSNDYSTIMIISSHSTIIQRFLNRYGHLISFKDHPKIFESFWSCWQPKQTKIDNLKEINIWNDSISIVHSLLTSDTDTDNHSHCSHPPMVICSSGGQRGTFHGEEQHDKPALFGWGYQLGRRLCCGENISPST